MYFILVLLLITVSVWVSARRRKREQEQALKVKRLEEFARALLDRQIELLSQGKPFSCTTFEVEISKVLRDCLIHCLAEGKCTPGDAWKAHGWLRAEFQDEFQEFVDDQEEWERRRYKLMKPDQDQ